MTSVQGCQSSNVAIEHPACEIIDLEAFELAVLEVVELLGHSRRAVFVEADIIGCEHRAESVRFLVLEGLPDSSFLLDRSRCAGGDAGERECCNCCNGDDPHGLTPLVEERSQYSCWCGRGSGLRLISTPMRLVILLSTLFLAACVTVPQSRPSVHAEVGIAFDSNGD